MRHGANLKEIADLLGHRLLKTTSIYTQPEPTTCGLLSDHGPGNTSDFMLGLARRYVSHRQMLGYKMTDAGRVAAFAEFMDRVAPGQPLTAARALEWVTADPAPRSPRKVGLLSTLRVSRAIVSR